ncbi:MAG: energy-coupling factor transporter transmembrane component T family protein [Lachnospirales bacterium]
MNVILGQFIPTGSFIEKLNAIAKILAVVFYIVSVFLCDSFLCYGICGLFLIFVIFLSHLPLKFIVKGLKPLLFILIFTAFMNLFFSREGKELFSFWIFKITDYSLITTFKISARLIFTIMFSSMLTLTTKPLELTCAIEDLLSPLKFFKVPVSEIAMIMSIALRFIPTLYDELEKIKMAQKSRGATFDEGNLYNRIKALTPVIIPLFVSAFRRADELAMAMEARCYNSKNKRTRLKKAKFGLTDFISLLVSLILVVTIIVLEKFL